MPQFIKHVGQVDNTGKKCVVIFRELPDDTSSCLVVETEDIPQKYHDELITAVESPAGQEEMDFYKYASRTSFHDGRNMLEALHLSGWLKKTSTNNVTMLPTREATIRLNELNVQLNELTNAGRTTSGDISSPAQDTTTQSNSPNTLSDSQIANNMRSQAAFFKKEAERLFAEAEAMDPQTTSKELVTEGVVPEVRVKRKYTKKK